MKLKRLKKNTDQKIGIFYFKLDQKLCFIFGLVFLFYSNQLFGITKKTFEIQFFDTNLNKKIDFNKLKKYGIDTVIIRTFQNKNHPKGLLFKNNLYKTINPLLDNLIISKKVAEAVDDSNVTNLWAWLITRNFNWLKNKTLFDYKYSNGELEIIKKYDLFNKNAVNKIIEIYKEIAKKNIDGILIQDDLIFRFNEGMSKAGIREFERLTGVSANIQMMTKNGTYYNKEWVKIKKKKILEILKKIIYEVKKINPKIKIGMNLYYETPLFVRRGELWYSHNLKELVKSGLDYIYLMSYQKQIKDEMKLKEKKNRDLFKKIVNRAFQIAGDKLVVKIQMYDWKNGKRSARTEILKYAKLIPKGVKKICFTPVKLKDIKFIRRVIKTLK